VKKVSVGKVTLGLVLILLGTAAFLDIRYGTSWLAGVLKYWPFALIMLGFEFILCSRNRENRVRLSPGAVLAIALAFLVAYGYEAGYNFVSINWGGKELSMLSEPHEKSFPVNQNLQGLDTVEVRTIGNVTVKGVPDKSLTGEVRISVRASSSLSAKEVAESWEPRIVPSGGRLIIEIEPPETRVKPLSFMSECRLELPSGMNLKINVVSGDVEISDVEGGVEMDSISGDITVDDRARSLDLNTVSGEVRVGLGKDTKVVKISTVSGDVDVRLSKDAGGQFHIETVSGDIDSSGGLTTTKGVKGKTADGNLGRGGTTVEITTVSGDVDVR